MTSNNDEHDILHKACHSMQARLDYFCSLLPEGDLDEDSSLDHEDTINNIIAIEAEWYLDPATAHLFSRLQDY